MVKEKEIPLKIEVFSNGEESDYLIHSKTEIRSILQTICERKTRVALYYDEGHRFVLTMLIAVSDEGVWVDPAPTQLDNNHITSSNKIVFVSTHNHAKVQFVATQARQEIYGTHDAIFLALPLKLVRLQRRDYYRLAAWPVNPLKCVIKPVPDQEHIKHEVTVMDISVGGISLVCQETDIELTPGCIYPNCEIELPEVGTLTATIQVKNTFQVTTRTGKVNHRAGCVFVKPDGKATMLLQRYVAQMQRKAAENAPK
jgi:c-di-GMP-binding flagellar brake protein YcgR